MRMSQRNEDMNEMVEKIDQNISKAHKSIIKSTYHVENLSKKRKEIEGESNTKKICRIDELEKVNEELVEKAKKDDLCFEQYKEKILKQNKEHLEMIRIHHEALFRDVRCMVEEMKFKRMKIEELCKRANEIDNESILKNDFGSSYYQKKKN